MSGNVFASKKLYFPGATEGHMTKFWPAEYTKWCLPCSDFSLTILPCAIHSLPPLQWGTDKLIPSFDGTDEDSPIQDCEATIYWTKGTWVHEGLHNHRRRVCLPTPGYSCAIDSGGAVTDIIVWKDLLQQFSLLHKQIHVLVSVSINVCLYWTTIVFPVWILLSSFCDQAARC